MLRLTEAIRISAGVPLHLEYHQERMDRSVYAMTGKHNTIIIEDELVIPDEAADRLYKCRIVYDSHIRQIDFLPYVKKNISSLKIVNAAIDYSLKYEDRSSLNHLYSMRGECDDILIARDGFITDTSSANIIFARDNEWFTPANPLLKGTAITRLLKEGVISERVITTGDIKSFTRASLVNAMLDPGEITISADRIFLS